MKSILASDDAQPFLDAIRAAPNEINPFLVFADWLQERGETLGEFVQLECQAKMHGVNDDLKQRINELYLAHRDEWKTPLFALGVENTGWRYGLVTYVEMSAKAFVENGEHVLCEAPILETLQLNDVRSVSKSLAQSQWLGFVKKLVVRDQPLSAATLRSLVRSPNLQNLEVLDLCGSKLSAAAMRSLSSAKLPKLRQLRLSQCGIDADGLRPLTETRGFPGLRGLYVPGNPIGDEGLGMIAEAPWFPSLEVLRLVETGIGQTGIMDLVGTASESSLLELEFEVNAIGDGGLATLVDWKGLDGLEVLGLNENQLTDAALEAIATSPYLRRLRELVIGHNRLTNAGVAVLAESSSLPSLEELTLEYTDVGDEGVLSLARSRGLGKLHSVKAMCCDIDEATVESVSRRFEVDY